MKTVRTLHFLGLLQGGVVCKMHIPVSTCKNKSWQMKILKKVIKYTLKKIVCLVLYYLHFIDIPMSPSNSFCRPVTSVTASPSGAKDWFNMHQFASRVLCMVGRGAEESCPTAGKRSSGQVHCRVPSFGHWRVWNKWNFTHFCGQKELYYYCVPVAQW